MISHFFAQTVLIWDSELLICVTEHRTSPDCRNGWNREKHIPTLSYLADCTDLQPCESNKTLVSNRNVKMAVMNMKFLKVKKTKKLCPWRGYKECNAFYSNGGFTPENMHFKKVKCFL